MADRTPVHEDSREVLQRLMIAADSGASVSEAELRNEFGLGHSDLAVILEQLREVGMAENVAPGEWVARLADDGLVDEPVRVSASVADEAELTERAPVTAPDSSAWPAGSAATDSVQLSAAMVDALGDDALGAVVRAGVLGAVEHGRLFVLRVRG